MIRHRPPCYSFSAQKLQPKKPVQLSSIYRDLEACEHRLQERKVGQYFKSAMSKPLRIDRKGRNSRRGETFQQVQVDQRRSNAKCQKYKLGRLVPQKGDQMSFEDHSINDNLNEKTLIYLKFTNSPIENTATLRPHHGQLQIKSISSVGKASGNNSRKLQQAELSDAQRDLIRKNIGPPDISYFGRHTTKMVPFNSSSLCSDSCKNLCKKISERDIIFRKIKNLMMISDDLQIPKVLQELIRKDKLEVKIIEMIKGYKEIVNKSEAN